MDPCHTTLHGAKNLTIFELESFFPGSKWWVVFLVCNVAAFTFTAVWAEVMRDDENDVGYAQHRQWQ